MATGNYTTHVLVRRLSGRDPTVVASESLGDGDGSQTVFYTEHYPIIDKDASEVADKDDITVYVDGTPATVSSIVANEGKITMSVAPGNGLAVTVDYWYSDVSETAIADAVLWGESEAEGLVGRVFTSGNAQTDIFDGDGNRTTFQLEKFPVTSITTVKVREAGKTTFDTKTLADGDGVDDDYWAYILNDDSYIEFEVAPIKGNRNIEIAYVYGYASVPQDIETLSTCLAAIYVHTVVDAGSSIKSYRLVEQEVEFGGDSPHDPAMRQLIERINSILSIVGRRKYIGIIR
jgi:hypothetical protein